MEWIAHVETCSHYVNGEGCVLVYTLRRVLRLFVVFTGRGGTGRRAIKRVL